MAALLLPADFREAGLKEYCAGYALSDDKADDTRLADAIARMTKRFEVATADLFSSTTATYTLAGGSRRVFLPHRCTAVTTLKTVDYAGAETTQAAALYRLHSSLDATGSEAIGKTDYAEIIEGYSTGLLSTYSPYRFDSGSGTVKITGTFGWTVAPSDVKHAIAILVYDHFQPIRNDLRQTERWSADGASYDRAQTEPFGLPEVDGIVAAYQRAVTVGVA